MPVRFLIFVRGQLLAFAVINADNIQRLAADKSRFLNGLTVFSAVAGIWQFLISAICADAGAAKLAVKITGNINNNNLFI